MSGAWFDVYETLYVVVGDYFIAIYYILPKKCVVKEISAPKRR